jgi:hypothetical protein
VYIFTYTCLKSVFDDIKWSDREKNKYGYFLECRIKGGQWQDEELIYLYVLAVQLKLV